MPFAENLDVFLADFGVSLRVGSGAQFLGILDGPDRAMNMGHANVITTDYVVEVKTSDVAANAIKRGTVIAVSNSPYIASGNYTVRDDLEEGDGAFTNVTLQK